MIDELKGIIKLQDASIIPGNGEDEGAKFPNGDPWAFCWSWANDLQQRLGGERVRRFGFDGDENETSEIGQLAGGHDFAIVDGRYIVDGWAANVEYLHKTGVLDLEDESEFADIERLFGDPRTWQDADAKFGEIDEEDEEDLRNQIAARIERAKCQPAII